MTGRLILVRHGETTANVEHRLDTILPGAALTERGQRQARAFGRKLAERPPQHLVHSPALRAQQTATLAAAEVNLTATELVGLHEIQAGDLEGRNDFEAIALYRKVFATWLGGDLRGSMPGGESGREALDRFLPTVAQFQANELAAGSDVVIVSHSAVIRLVAQHLTGMASEFAVMAMLANTDAVELVHREGAWRPVSWAKHQFR